MKRQLNYKSTAQLLSNLPHYTNESSEIIKRVLDFNLLLGWWCCNCLIRVVLHMGYCSKTLTRVILSETWKKMADTQAFVSMWEQLLGINSVLWSHLAGTWKPHKVHVLFTTDAQGAKNCLQMIPSHWTANTKLFFFFSLWQQVKFYSSHYSGH